LGLPAATATYHAQKCAQSEAIVFKNRRTSSLSSNSLFSWIPGQNYRISRLCVQKLQVIYLLVIVGTPVNKTT